MAEKTTSRDQQTYDHAASLIAAAVRQQELDLSELGLTKLPPSISRLTNLQVLTLSYNQLKVVPDSLRGLTQLQALNLSGNQLTTIPDWLHELTQLQTLSLVNNQLTTVPDGLRKLTQLRIVILNTNKLKTIPEWMIKMPRLKELYIKDNPITQPPPEQLGSALTSWEPVDLETIQRYYAQLQREGEAFFYEAKVLLIGEGGAGKTSLACKLIDPTTPLPPPDESTEGIDIQTWEFPIPPNSSSEAPTSDPPIYQANIWDFGGQSVYHATHQFFLSKRSVYVLLADTRRQHTDFYDWLRMQETFGENSPILLLKNKNRQHGNQFVIENLPQLRERFPNLDEIIELDLENVPNEEEWPKLLHYLQERLMMLDHIGVPRPKTWVNIRQELRQVIRKNDINRINRRQFLALCSKYGINDEQDALQLSDYLHHIGDILHFEDDPVLADLVILKPTWALDAVYRVLDNEEIAAHWGQFNRQQLRHLWHEAKYDNHREQLLRLMQKFKLCYQLRDVPDNFIAPQLLQLETPEYVWDGNGEDLQLRYRYPIFMPRGILSRATVSLHHRIEAQEYVWRSGVLLRDEYARAELLELRGEKEIRLRVTGGNKRDLLMEIVRALDELHLSFSDKLKYDKLVPCRCNTCRASSDPHFFALGKLLERLSYRKKTIECNSPPYAEVQIHSLIDDAILQTEMRGGHVHYGDIITVGDISEARGVAIGRSASGSVSELG